MRTHVCTHVYNNIHIWCIFSSIFFCTHLVSKINPILLCHLSNLIYFLCITIPLIFNFSPILYIFHTTIHVCTYVYIRICTYFNTCIYIYIFFRYISIYIRCIFTYIYMCMYIYVDTHIESTAIMDGWIFPTSKKWLIFTRRRLN